MLLGLMKKSEVLAEGKGVEKKTRSLTPYVLLRSIPCNTLLSSRRFESNGDLASRLGKKKVQMVGNILMQRKAA